MIITRKQFIHWNISLPLCLYILFNITTVLRLNLKRCPKGSTLKQNAVAHYSMNRFMDFLISGKRGFTAWSLAAEEKKIQYTGREVDMISPVYFESRAHTHTQTLCSRLPNARKCKLHNSCIERGWAKLGRCPTYPPLWPATVRSLNGKGGDDRSVRACVCACVYCVCVCERVGVCLQIKQEGRKGGQCARGRCGRILARGRASMWGRGGGGESRVDVVWHVIRAAKHTRAQKEKPLAHLLRSFKVSPLTNYSFYQHGGDTRIHMRKPAFSFSAYAHIYKRVDGWSASGARPGVCHEICEQCQGIM